MHQYAPQYINYNIMTLLDRKKAQGSCTDQYGYCTSEPQNNELTRRRFFEENKNMSSWNIFKECFHIDKFTFRKIFRKYFNQRFDCVLMTCHSLGRRWSQEFWSWSCLEEYTNKQPNSTIILPRNCLYPNTNGQVLGSE